MAGKGKHDESALRLYEWVVVTANSAHDSRFVRQITFGHIRFGGAVAAVEGTRDSFGEERERHNARDGTDFCFDKSRLQMGNEVRVQFFFVAKQHKLQPPIGRRFSIEHRILFLLEDCAYMFVPCRGCLMRQSTPDTLQFQKERDKMGFKIAWEIRWVIHYNIKKWTYTTT